MPSEAELLGKLKERPGLNAGELATNSVGHAQSSVAVGVPIQFNLFERLKWSIAKKER